MGKIIGIIGYAIMAGRQTDVYVFSSALPLAAVPWALYFLELEGETKKKILFMAIAGFFSGFAQYIRYQSGTAMAIFLCSLLLLSPDGRAGALLKNVKAKAILLAVMAVGFIAPAVFFSNLIDRRDAFLEKNVADYQRRESRHHILWHGMYIGLGYLDNEYGIRFRDENAFEKADSISPGVIPTSDAYEEIIKKEYLDILKKDHYFVSMTYFSKAGGVAYYLLLYANVGLLAAYLYPKKRPVEFAFWSALGFCALLGILGYPTHNYLLGFIAFSTLYGLVSIDHALFRFHSRASEPLR